MNVKAGRDPALGTAPVGKLFWKLALPAIAAQLDGLPRLAVLHRGHDLLADIVQGLPYLHPQGGGQAHGGVRVDG